jgi:type I restriction-modification system DNA methylase subunit
MFTTRLIGRILFIWFLRKKALINQKIGYFEVGSSSNQNDYYKKKLEILFFEVLNKEISTRQASDKETPYLNGGLFDVNETDFYDDKNLSFPNGFFNNLFETLNKYNFTVDESSPEFQQVAIDPEMLGRIFESLLAEQIDEETGSSQKKVTGAFYTPREIVNYMCEQSIIEFIKSKVPDTTDRDRRIEELVRLPETIFRDQDQNKRRDWKPYSEKILKILIGDGADSPISILDPAVGSGAFPMGMLHLIVKICTRLDSRFENSISNLKRRILSKSLYGVDIQQSAIEICRLRAWLSIIVDISEGDVVEPLPNLDFKFICANTLVALSDDNQHSLFEDVNLKEKLNAAAII